jgi:hypothetical protein
MKVTKKLIDELAAQARVLEDLNKALKEQQARYNELLKPVLEYGDTLAGPTEKVVLQGTASVCELSAKRATRKIDDVAKAYHMLEEIETGLGLANISIPLKVLDENLRKKEVEALCSISYGSRSLKVLSGGH